MKKRFVKRQPVDWVGIIYMRLIQNGLLLSAGVALVLLVGCSSAPTTKSQMGDGPQNGAPVSKAKLINAETLNAESKSIAVTDIYYKKEGKNPSFVEETKNKSESTSASTLTPQVIAVDADKANASALTGGPNSSAFPVKFTNLADPASTSPSTTPTPDTGTPKATDSSVSNASSSANTQTIKKSGYETKMEYGELRYLASPIRGVLINSGYKVVQAKPSVPTQNQGDEYFDIVQRIKAGDFGDANYVLYGVLEEISFTDNVDEIPGTKSSSQQVALDVVVDFNLVDTQTSQIVASFIASGGGHDIRIDGRDANYKPSMAKLMKEASLSLAEDVAKHLQDQNFVVANPANDKRTEGRNFKRRLDDDASSLKVYGK